MDARQLMTRGKGNDHTSVCRAWTSTDCRESAVGVEVGVSAEDDDADEVDKALALRAALAA